MKILSSEKIDNWSYVWHCYHCKSKLQAEPNDLNYKLERKYCGVRDDDYTNVSVYYVVCPVCNIEHHLDEKQLPYLLKQKARTKKGT